MIFERDYMIYKNYFLCLILIYCIGIGLRLYWANNKENMHQDEVATFSISECDGAYYSPDVKVPPKVTATGKDIKRFFFIHDNRIKGTLHDLRYMWHNVYDYNHTNFYYSLIRIFFTGSNTTDVKSINIRGILLNLFFFTLSFIVLLHILQLYYSTRKELILLTMFCYTTMVGSVSNALFIRPYELQTLTVLLLAYWLTKIKIRIKSGYWRYGWKEFLLMSVILAAVLLTGYFMIGFVLIYGIFMLIETYKHNNFYKGSLFFIGTGIVAILLCWLCYQSYFLGFGGDARIASKMSELGIVSLVTDTISTWFELITNNTLHLPILILSLIAIIYGRGQRQIPHVFFPALIFSFAVMILAPYKNNRYMVAVTPLLLLIIPAATQCFKNIKVRWIYILITIITYISMSIQEKNISTLYPRKTPLEMLNEKRRKVYLIQRDHWEISPFVAVLNDDITYNISDTLYTESLCSGDVVVYSTNSNDTTLLKDCRFEKKGRYGYHNFYRVK